MLRSQSVAHVKDPTTTFRQEIEELPNRVTAEKPHHSIILIRMMIVPTLDGKYDQETKLVKIKIHLHAVSLLDGTNVGMWYLGVGGLTQRKIR